MFYLGGPVWGAKKWLGTLFPPGTATRDFLSTYSRRLNTVEGNGTFYAMPSLETMRRWREETPADFRFCCKFPRTISHDLKLHSAAQETATWLSCLRALGERAGPAFLQLPPDFSPAQLPLLRGYLRALPPSGSTGLRFAVEVRHPGWFQPGPEAALGALLRELGMARVLFDVRPLRGASPQALEDADAQEALRRKPDVPVRFLRTAPFTLIRYISHPDPAANDAFLDQWVDALAAWLTEGTEVFFFLHHPGDQHVPTLCRELHQRLSARVPLPPLPPFPGPAQDLDRGGERPAKAAARSQLSLF